ncbi:thiopeptide-type bacteriocin biosynthesis protein [Kitasatospora griseola]|uniref:thiopeptide-type bacteriocin biosynthesis protein n=1 Tax=Kitasatospora griseola TaxID=2064 RepID=UPI0036DE26C7
MTTPQDMGWRSWHLHIATFVPAALDAVVTEVVGPLADRLELLEPDGPPWFFVRYWQGGPHLRLRVSGLTQAESNGVEVALASRLHALDAATPPARRIDQETYARAVRRLAAAGEQGVPLPAGELLAPGVRRATYQPEYQRYGGRHRIAESELLFHCSSRVALRACLARAGTPHALASGLEAFAAACSVLDGGEDGRSGSRSRFLTAQRDAWLDWTLPSDTEPDSSVPAHTADTRRQRAVIAQAQAAALGTLAPRLREAMRDGDPRWAEWTDPLGAALRTWTAEFGSARAAGIFGSHLHMTANRLGVGLGQQTRITELLLALLGPATPRPGPD